VAFNVHTSATMTLREMSGNFSVLKAVTLKTIIVFAVESLLLREHNILFSDF